jgi:hypothetical protein
MSGLNVSLTGAVDTVHGATVRVFQDHDGVRIDTGLHEFMFGQDAARDLAGHIMTAILDARRWEVTA